MELFLLLLVVSGFAIIMSAVVGAGNTPRTCDQFGVPHVWITKVTGDDSYLVCQKCKALPGGLTEEGGDYDGY